MVQKILGKSDISKETKGKGIRKKKREAIGGLHIEERLNERPRLQWKHKDENEAKQNKRNTREKHHDICKSNVSRIQVRVTCG